MSERATKGIEAAMWRGDVDELQQVAGCICCCADHTFEGCPARAWGGCRGQYTMTRAEVESWAAHYEKYHGMTREAFFAC